MTPAGRRCGDDEGVLWELVARRLEAGADREALERDIWARFGCELAIMCTDLAGFSRHAARHGIVHFLGVILEHRRLLAPVVERYGGRLLGGEADSLLVTFAEPAAAVACAVAMQRACQDYNRGRRAEERALLCIGLGWGRVLRAGDSTVFGAEVNAASKLGEDTADAEEILATRALVEAVGPTPGLRFVPLDATVPGTDLAFEIVYDR